MSRLPLERWKPQEPPSDFLARIDQALDAQASPAPPRPLLRRRSLLVGLSAAAAAAGVWGNVALTRKILRGTLVARTRTELEVAPGVVAVAEPGAHLSYRDGAIQQHDGEVTYRAEAHADLRLDTPSGTAVGRGACCRVRVFPAASPRLETSGPATVLAVFQGQVDLHHAGRTERLSPSRYALASGGSIRTERDDRRGLIARALSLPVPAEPPPSASSTAPEPPPSAPVASAPPPRPRRSAPPASVPAVPPAVPPAAPPASASAAPSARPFIVPRCLCVPNDSLCLCPE